VPARAQHGADEGGKKGVGGLNWPLQKKKKGDGKKGEGKGPISSSSLVIVYAAMGRGKGKVIGGKSLRQFSVSNATYTGIGTYEGKEWMKKKREGIRADQLTYYLVGGGQGGKKNRGREGKKKVKRYARRPPLPIKKKRGQGRMAAQGIIRFLSLEERRKITVLGADLVSSVTGALDDLLEPGQGGEQATHEKARADRPAHKAGEGEKNRKKIRTRI